MEDSIHGHHQMVNTEMRLIIFFAAKDGEALYSQQKHPSHLFTAICKASSDSHFAFLHFFFFGMVLIPVSCTMSQASIYSSSGTLSIRSSPLNLFLTSTVQS